MQNLFLPPLEDLDEYDTRYLTRLSPKLDQQVQSVTGKINGMKRKQAQEFGTKAPLYLTIQPPKNY